MDNFENNESQNKVFPQTISSGVRNEKNESLKKFNYKAFLPYLIVIAIGIIIFIFYGKNEDIIEISRTHNENEKLELVTPQIYYHEMKDLLIQINFENEDKFLKITLNIQTDKKNVLQQMQELSPQIEDAVQSYLRQLSSHDFKSTFGLYKIRGDLMLRINTIIYPNKVDAVFLKDVIIK